MFVLPSGEVFCSDPLYPRGAPRGNESILYDPTAGAITASYPGPATVSSAYTNEGNTGAHMTAALLPLLPEEGYRPRVLLAGGAEALVIDLGAPDPRWRPTAPRTLPGAPERLHANAVLLPTGEVLVAGGVQLGRGDDEHAGVREPELYDAAKGTWSHDAARATVPRQYHSVALLMPDGRVFTAGSDKQAHEGIAWAELRLEIYEPWYVAERRPVVSAAPAAARYGERFEVQAGADVARVAVIRAGSCTHAFDPDQRYVGLSFEKAAGDRLEVTAPPDAAVAPPGWYLLFVVDRSGVPSVGRFLAIGR